MQTIILLSLFFSHFICDFTYLSTNWMLDAKRFGKPLYPIFIHSTVHAVGQLLILSLLFGITGQKLMILFLIQLISHFLIDTWKGKMNGWLPILQSPSNKEHWIIFGFDQFLHAVVIIFMSHIAVYF